MSKVKPNQQPEELDAPGPNVEPLVHSDVNVSTFPWAPARLDYFPNHPLALHPSGEPFRAIVILVSQAWRQQPAMSLPNDDAKLASMAGFGRDVSNWQQVREDVLRDWSLASDGRWYHPEFAAWALQSWSRKLEAEQFSERQRQRAMAGARSRGAAGAQPNKRGDQKEDKKDREIRNEQQGDQEDLRIERETILEIPLLSSAPHPRMTQTSDKVILMDEKEEYHPVDEVKQITSVFEHWRQQTRRPEEVLTAARSRILKSRLAEGLSPEILCRAIDAAAADDFYQGRTAKQTQRIDTLDVICRDRDRVLRLASAGDAKPRSQPSMSHAATATARTFLEMFEPAGPTTIDVPATPSETEDRK